MGLIRQGGIANDRLSGAGVSRDAAARTGPLGRQRPVGTRAERGAFRERLLSCRLPFLVVLLGLLLLFLLADRERNDEPASAEPPATPVAVMRQATPRPVHRPIPNPRDVNDTAGNPPSQDSGTQPADEAPARIAETQSLTVEPSENGAYFVSGTINGHDVTFLIDTGSSWISIPERLKQTLQLLRGRYIRVSTAGGVVGNYETVVEHLALGPFEFNRVRGILNPSAPTDLVLLGMSALKELQIVQKDGRLILTQQPAGRADEVAETAPRNEPLIIRRSVRECMGPGQVIDRSTLSCLEGQR